MRDHDLGHKVVPASLPAKERTIDCADRTLRGPLSDSDCLKVLVGSERGETFASWLPQLIRQNGRDVKVTLFTDGAAIPVGLKRYKPDVLLLDKVLLERLNARALGLIREFLPRVRVLTVSDDNNDELLGDVLNNGFHGFLLTDCAPELAQKAICAVAQGEIWLPRASLAKVLMNLRASPLADGTTRKTYGASWARLSDALTPREAEVVGLVQQGWTNKQIASNLEIVEDTVKKHLQSIFRKLGVRRRTMILLEQFDHKFLSEVTTSQRKFRI